LFFDPNKLTVQPAATENHWRFWGGMLLADRIVGLFPASYSMIRPFVAKLHVHAELRVRNQVGISYQMHISTTKTQGSNNHDG